MLHHRLHVHLLVIFSSIKWQLISLILHVTHNFCFIHEPHQSTNSVQKFEFVFKFRRSTKSYTKRLNRFHLGSASGSGIDCEIVSQRHDVINEFQDEVWTCCHYVCTGFVIRTGVLPTVTLKTAIGMWPSLLSRVIKRCLRENERHSSRDAEKKELRTC